jgi:5-methylcytosine-specific restriction endonuclease McrA
MGIYVPATQVHHKIWLTEENINDPSVTLNLDNLEALCEVCHAKEHHAAIDVGEDLRFDADGNLLHER